jgi:DNA invertase Pin-like site-specific DNA recombinase
MVISAVRGLLKSLWCWYPCWYVENESGATLARPELFRLLADTQPGDVLLVEQVDRLSRLTTGDWDRLKVN